MDEIRTNYPDQKKICSLVLYWLCRKTFLCERAKVYFSNREFGKANIFQSNVFDLLNVCETFGFIEKVKNMVEKHHFFATLYYFIHSGIILYEIHFCNNCIILYEIRFCNNCIIFNADSCHCHIPLLSKCQPWSPLPLPLNCPSQQPKQHHARLLPTF